MYTRFKSSKNGLKLGLNTITNNTRSRVAVSNNTNGNGNISPNSPNGSISPNSPTNGNISNLI